MFRIQRHQLSEVQSAVSAGQAVWGAVQAPLHDPTETSTEDGYRFIENTPIWKQMCDHLPCFAEMWWPNYLTKVVRVRIHDHDLIIQLWKGWCERFGGRWADFPGGIGAEVGIYKKYSDKKAESKGELFYKQTKKIDRGLHASRNGLTAAARRSPALTAATTPLPRHDRPHGDPQGEAWYPYLEHLFPLQFQLVDPVTGRVFFGTGVERTYWLTRWMYEQDYRQYRKSHSCPAFAANYRLQYSVSGRQFEW